VVYAKRPFAGPAQVLTYLSRYTHRIAIANSRLVSMAEGKVTFRWRDYAHGHQTRTMDSMRILLAVCCSTATRPTLHSFCLLSLLRMFCFWFMRLGCYVRLELRWPR
jgi:hypothetical protein